MNMSNNSAATNYTIRSKLRTCIRRIFNLYKHFASKFELLSKSEAKLEVASLYHVPVMSKSKANFFEESMGGGGNFRRI